MFLRIFLLLSILSLSACSFFSPRGPSEKIIAASLKARELALAPYQQDPEEISTYRNVNLRRCIYKNRAEYPGDETYDRGMDDSWVCKFSAESSSPSNDWKKAEYIGVFVRSGHPDGTGRVYKKGFELESLVAQEDWRKMKDL